MWFNSLHSLPLTFTHVVTVLAYISSHTLLCVSLLTISHTILLIHTVLFFLPVSVSVKDSETICPSSPITLRCVVNTTQNTRTHLLLWKCSKRSSERTVICDPIHDFDCPFGKVKSVNVSCDCEDLIVSEATFTPNSTAARTLVCGDGIQEQEVSLLPKGIQPLEALNLQYVLM